MRYVHSGFARGCCFMKEFCLGKVDFESASKYCQELFNLTKTQLQSKIQTSALQDLNADVLYYQETTVLVGGFGFFLHFKP